MSTQHRLVAPVLALVLVALVIVIFAPVSANMVVNGVDYYEHIEDAQALKETGETLRPRPHMLYHRTVGLIHTLLPGVDYFEAALVLDVGTQVMTALLVFVFTHHALAGVNLLLRNALALLIPLVALLVWAITLFTEDGLYFGFIGPNPYHNPTINLLRPLALLLFLLVLPAFRQRGGGPHPPGPLLPWGEGGVSPVGQSPSPGEQRIETTTPTSPSPGGEGFRVRAKTGPFHPAWIIATVITVILATTAKPSYTISLLPALAVYGAYRVWRRQTVNLWLLVVGVFIPAGIILFDQYMLQSSEMGGMDFAPFFVIGQIADSALLQVLLSLAFPLAVYLAYFRQAVHDLALNLAWLVFGVALAYFLLFAEGGYWQHLNFYWGPMLSLFIVFVTSMVFLARQILTAKAGDRPRLSVRLALTLILLALHLVSGIQWYSTQMTPAWGTVF